MENGQKVCKYETKSNIASNFKYLAIFSYLLIHLIFGFRCAGNYYGSQCDIDGEVLAVAIGASVSAVVIIGLTLACLCMWR